MYDGWINRWIVKWMDKQISRLNEWMGWLVGR